MFTEGALKCHDSLILYFAERLMNNTNYTLKVNIFQQPLQRSKKKITTI